MAPGHVFMFMCLISGAFASSESLMQRAERLGLMGRITITEDVSMEAEAGTGFAYDPTKLRTAFYLGDSLLGKGVDAGADKVKKTAPDKFLSVECSHLMGDQRSDEVWTNDKATSRKCPTNEELLKKLGVPKDRLDQAVKDMYLASKFFKGILSEQMQDLDDSSSSSWQQWGLAKGGKTFLKLQGFSDFQHKFHERLLHSIRAVYFHKDIYTVLTTTEDLASKDSSVFGHRLRRTRAMVEDMIMKQLEPAQHGLIWALSLGVFHKHMRGKVTRAEKAKNGKAGTDCTMVSGSKKETGTCPYINLDSLLWTELCFSLATLWVPKQDQWDDKVTPASKDAWIRTWSLIGELMGVPHESSPQNFEEAKTLFKQMIHSGDVLGTEGPTGEIQESTQTRALLDKLPKKPWETLRVPPFMTWIDKNVQLSAAGAGSSSSSSQANPKNKKDQQQQQLGPGQKK